MAGKKYALYREERAKGMSYQEIADKYGVSKQCVHQACANGGSKYFQRVTEKGCVYPNLRKWLNDSRITKKEMLVRMGLEPHGENYGRLSSYLRGYCDPPKRTIDKLIQATGMSYEELFAEEGD